jgi:lysophospholipase L1-like esterase
VSFRFQFRRGTTAERDAANPVLAAGEPAVVLDSGQPAELVLGDGVSAMADLRTVVWDDDVRLADAETAVQPADLGTAAVANVADLATAAQGAAAELAFPVQTIAYLGDSLMPQSSYVYGTYTHWAGVARSLLGHRHNDGLCAGVGGETSTQIAARVGAVVASAPTYCMVDSGVNDIGTGVAGSATVIANLTTIIDTLTAAGIKPIVLTMTPSVFINTPAKLADAGRVNDWIKALPTTRGVNVIDWRAAVADFASTTGAWTAAWSADGIHPNHAGSIRLGQCVAAALDKIIMPGPGPLLSDAGIGSGILSTNPGMTGTSGTLGTGVTGTAPTGYTVEPQGSTACVSSIVARTDLVGANWLNLAVTGGVTRVFQQNTAVGVDWNVGDTVWFEAEILMENTPTNLRSFTAQLDFWNGVGLVSDSPMQLPPATVTPLLGSPMRAVLRTKPTVVPAGTARLQSKLFVEIIGTGSATVKVGRYAIRKAI